MASQVRRKVESAAMKASVVESCKESAFKGMEMFQRNFSHVPDEQLEWNCIGIGQRMSGRNRLTGSWRCIRAGWISNRYLARSSRGFSCSRFVVRFFL